VEAARWQKLRKLLDEALDLEPAQRLAFAGRVDDHDLRADLMRMLARQEHSTPLDRPAAVLVSEAISEPAARDWDREQIGRRIGVFILDDLLGAGGMGTVYRAHRVDGRLNQTVAIKLVLSAHPGMRERFRKEQEIVAGLRHPNIAQLIDAGESEDGIPYLAMEYVDGVSITEFCRDRLPDAGSRVRLMLRVASALAHAHRNLVIHRDIKPSNILVTEDGLPILLDFGIAKLVGEDRFHPVTAQRLGPMTPAYAAPEQFRGGMISVATDVYQFGALLYRVLTGQLPYAADPHDAINWGRAVLEDDPIPLGRAIAQAHRAESTEMARDAVRTLGKDINRDLDAILRTALAKEPVRRYGSIDALVADLEAFLDGRPVHARHGDRWYHVTRFLKRHWLSTAVASLAIIGLVAATAVSWHFTQRARHEAERAALAVDFLNTVMNAADPMQGLGHRSSAEDVLKHALDNFQGSFAEHPDLRAPLMVSLGTTFANMGLPDESYGLFKQSLADFSAAQSDPLKQAEAYERASFVAYRSGHPEDAELWANESVRLALGDSELAYWVRDGNALNRWARLREAGQNDEALLLATKSLAEARAAPAAFRDRIVHRALGRHATSLTGAGDLVTAEAEFREALALAKKVYGEDRFPYWRSRSGLAWFLVAKGEADRAIAEFHVVCPRLRALLGEHAFDYGSCMYNWSNAWAASGQYEKAIASYRQAANIYSGGATSGASVVGHALQNVAHLQHRLGDYSAAQATWQEVAQAWTSTIADDAPVWTPYRVARARTELALGRIDDTEALLARALSDDTSMAANPGLHANALFLSGQTAEKLDDPLRARVAYADARDVLDRSDNADWSIEQRAELDARIKALGADSASTPR